MFRTCSKCGVEKPLEQYNKERGKPRAYCKACHRAAVGAWQKANPDKRRVIAKRFLTKYRLANPPKKGGRPRKYTPEEYAVKDREWKRAWSLRNAPYVMEKTRRYQASKMRATPVWADKDAMRDVYAEALRRTTETGIPHEVDHIVPLTSPIVCGLHCEANLRVVAMTVNRKKANKVFDV